MVHDCGHRPDGQLIKAQGEKLGFNLKIQQAKQLLTLTSILVQKWQSCLQESQNESVFEDCFPLFYNPR